MVYAYYSFVFEIFKQQKSIIITIKRIKLGYFSYQIIVIIKVMHMFNMKKQKFLLTLVF